MKKIALISALAALVALPALGIEVYNNEEKEASVNIYGNLKGFIGGSGAFPQINNSNADGSGNFLIGLQTNSNFGIDTKLGKMSAKIEFGLTETGFLGNTAEGPGLRIVSGSYDFGSAGKVTFGKFPTVTSEGGFQSNFNNNDAGGNGFGSITTSDRKLQVEYANSGVRVAIIADEATAGSSAATAYTQPYADGARLDYAPRIALGYEGKIGEKGKFKVALAYKYWNKAGSFTGTGNSTGNSITGKANLDVHSAHLQAGAKIPLSDNYLSVFFNYGLNGHLYRAQQTAYSDGLYGYKNSDNLAGLWAQRAGLLVEFGGKVSDLLSFAAGAGYQATFNGVGQRGTTYNGGLQSMHGYQIYANVPINVAKGFQIVPQLAFYDTISTGNHGYETQHNAALLGLVRLQYSF